MPDVAVRHHPADGHAGTGLSRCLGGSGLALCLGGGVGNWLHSLPSSSRPADFGVLPPHCLKKNGTPAPTHWSLTSRTQSGSMGRWRVPLSPPTITQWMPVRSSGPSGPRSGSTDRNLTGQRASLRWSTRTVLALSSTETLTQT